MKKTSAVGHVGGEFVNENYVPGAQGTQIDAADLNTHQRELVALIEDYGEVLDPADDTQIADLQARRFTKYVDFSNGWIVSGLNITTVGLNATIQPGFVALNGRKQQYVLAATVALSNNTDYYFYAYNTADPKICLVSAIPTAIGAVPVFPPGSQILSVLRVTAGTVTENVVLGAPSLRVGNRISTVRMAAVNYASPPLTNTAMPLVVSFDPDGLSTPAGIVVPTRTKSVEFNWTFNTVTSALGDQTLTKFITTTFSALGVARAFYQARPRNALNNLLTFVGRVRIPLVDPILLRKFTPSLMTFVQTDTPTWTISDGELDIDFISE